MGIIKREKSLFYIFTKCLFSLFIKTIIIATLIICISNIGFSSGTLYPANYAQNHLDKLKYSIKTDENFDIDNLKVIYRYGIYDKSNKLIENNFNKTQLEEANNYLVNKKYNTKYIYTDFKIKDKTYVISYDLKVHFSSETLNNIFPCPEYQVIILFFVLFFIMTILTINKFSKILKNELNPLKEIIYHIKKQDLNCTAKSTNIKEFNEVLKAIEDMKIALKESLNKQWQEEENKKEQMSALAHDIKTPLTIIKGNTELLLEDEEREEERNYLEYIIKNSQKIENYISLLMDISKVEGKINFIMKNINFDDFVEKLKLEIEMICSQKNIEFSIQIQNSIDSFLGDEISLIRAILNIVSNAVDYSTQNGKIEITINSTNNKLIFTVKDFGSGFTKQSLKRATERFYMENKERKYDNHYGIGLYFASTVAKNHHGELILKNREDTKGAEVSLSIIISNIVITK